MKNLQIVTFALAATVSAWGATVCADKARDLVSRGSMATAADRYAVPLVSLAALSAACLGVAAGSVTDQHS